MNIALVSSKGGHLGQFKMIFTKDVIGKSNLILVTEDENRQGLESKSFLSKYDVYKLKKDYLGINPFRYLLTLIKLIRLFKVRKVDIIFTNGAQLSIPAVIAGKICGIKTVFIDTVIRVKTPNWSAKVSYIFSDKFFVQHREMTKKYGKKAEYIGGII